METTTTPRPIPTYTFAVTPAIGTDADFAPFLLDVPSLSGEDVAARRGYWVAFNLLGRQGYEPEQFSVCAWRDGLATHPVGRQGLL